MNTQQFRFTQDSQYGTLVYSLQPGEQLLHFDHCMMTNNNINGILGYSVETGAGGVSLSYNILRGTRLSLLKNRVISGQYMITILVGIANVLITSEQYMLKEKQFVLSEDCIFVDTGTATVNLVYIPTNAYSGITFAQFVRFFITNGSFNYGEDAGHIMSLLNFINTNQNASADEIKAFLDKVRINSNSAVKPVQSAPRAMPAAPDVQKPVQPVNMPAPTPVPQPAPVMPTNSGNSAAGKAAAEKNGIFSKMFGGGNKPKSEPTAGGAISGMNIPGMPQNDSGRAISGMNIPGMAKPVQQNPVPENKQPEKKKMFKKDVPAANVSPSPAPTPAAAHPVNAALEIATEPDNQSNETVLLNSGNYARGSSPRAFLIGKNGERVAITNSGFTIGKENTSGVSNDYTIKNSSVSRNHAMFEIRDGRYFVVDMTSLNGTFVNGSRINSNVRVEVNNGDTIVFANVEYRFVIE